jgi:hypothetical protein
VIESAAMRARLQKLIDVLSGARDGKPELRRAALARAAALGAGALPGGGLKRARSR